MAETAVPIGNTFMDDDEQLLADQFYEAMMRFNRESPRSQQAGRFQIGVSDLGFCPERTRRMLNGETPEPTDVLPAFLGTAIGDHAERAWAQFSPTALVQASVEIEFTILIDGSNYKVTVPGHPDIIEPERGILLDVKTDEGLADAERQGPDLQKQFQRHDYGLAAFNRGLFADHIALEDVKVGNVWIDRSGGDRYVHVNLEPLNLDYVAASQAWLEDVVYHLVNRQPAQKVPPRDMCEKICGFFGPCRGRDTDVEGLLDDPILVERVKMYDEGRELEKEGARLKRSAKAHLEGTSGHVRVGEQLFQLRSTWVNPTLVPESTRRGYDKLEIRRVKG